MKELHTNQSPSSEEAVKSRILDATEALLSDRGMNGVTPAAIAARAGISLEALRRHFDSDETLFQKLLWRRIVPLNEERLRLLRSAESIAEGGRPSLEAILRAFMIPMVRVWQSGRCSIKLMGRLRGEPSLSPCVKGAPLSDEVRQRFKAAFLRALPGISEADLHWRLHFIKGAFLQTWENPEEVEAYSDGCCTMSDVDAVVDRLVSFSAAGLRAPSK